MSAGLWAGASGLVVAVMLAAVFAAAYGFEAGYKRYMQQRLAVERSRRSRAGMLAVPDPWIDEPCACGALAGEPCRPACAGDPRYGVSYATWRREG